jgi:hypothetical protein
VCHGLQLVVDEQLRRHHDESWNDNSFVWQKYFFQKNE